MSFTDEELGYTNVYLCKKCDEDKPRRDFYKGVGQSKMESILNTTKELRKGQKHKQNHLNYISSSL